MERPASIQQFDKIYLGAYAVGLVNTALSWRATSDQMLDAGQPTWLLPLSTAFGFAITLLLWYFIAQRGSIVAKWIAVVLMVVALLASAFAFAMGRYPAGISGVLGVVSMVLQVIAIWLLFRSDTKAWFREKPAPADPVA